MKDPSYPQNKEASQNNFIIPPKVRTWLRNLAVKEMPKAVGTSAMPRLRKRLPALNFATVSARSAKSERSFTRSQHVWICVVS